MNSEFRKVARVEFQSRPRWIVDGAESRFTPTKGARVVDLRGSFTSGQLLAGTGALVFEGELLEGPRLN